MLQVAAKKQTLKSVTDYITDIICKRSKLGYNYGVILIPEGLIDFIPEVLSWSNHGTFSFFSFLHHWLSYVLSEIWVFVSLSYGETISEFWLSLLCNLQVQQLISELNEILAHDSVDETGMWKKKLQSQSQELFELFPQAIQEQLLLERDPHGNVQVIGNILSWIVGLLS